MGIAFILLGVLAAGIVADFVVENDLAGGAQEFSLLGGSFTFTESQLVVGAALLGGLSVLLAILGIGVLRGSWGRRKAMKHRMQELEAENAALRSRQHLAAALRSPSEQPGGAEPDVIRIEEPEATREEARAEPRG